MRPFHVPPMKRPHRHDHSHPQAHHRVHVGFFCPSCLATAQTTLSDLEGVASVEVVVPPGHLVVSHDLQQVSVDELIKVVTDITSTAHSSGSEW